MSAVLPGSCDAAPLACIPSFPSSFFYEHFCGGGSAGDGTQGLAPAKHVPYRWAAPRPEQTLWEGQLLVAQQVKLQGH